MQEIQVIMSLVHVQVLEDISNTSVESSHLHLIWCACQISNFRTKARKSEAKGTNDNCAMT